MLNLLKISVAVVVLFSLVYIVFHFIPIIWWQAPDYRCAILNDSVVLRAEGSSVILGVLGKGTVLFAPSKRDLALTDPNNVYLHKVYIQIPNEVFKNLTLLPARKSTDMYVPKTINRILVANLQVTFTNKTTDIDDSYQQEMTEFPNKRE